MISSPPKYFWLFPLLFIASLFTLVMGCGAVGSPIPPEDVGIAAKVRKQQKETRPSELLLAEDEAVSTAEEETVELPTFYPIRTR